MRHSLLQSIAAAGVLFFGLSYGQAVAQYQDDDAWHHDRDSYYHGQEWRVHLFDRVRTDLDHVQMGAFAGDDVNRIAHTKLQLTELQGKLAGGGFNQPELDDVIASMNRVIADNRLSARDRDMLTDDLSRLRDYREHHADWH